MKTVVIFSLITVIILLFYFGEKFQNDAIFYKDRALNECSLVNTIPEAWDCDNILIHK